MKVTCVKVNWKNCLNDTFGGGQILMTINDWADVEISYHLSAAVT